MDIFNKVKLFLKEAYNELRKVSWLSRKEVIGSTAVIIIFVCMTAIFISLVDFILSYVLSAFLHR